MNDDIQLSCHGHQDPLGDLCNLPIYTIIKKYIFTLSRLILIIENIFLLKKLTIYSDCHNDPTLQYFTCLHIVTLIQVCLYTNRKKKKKNP